MKSKAKRERREGAKAEKWMKGGLFYLGGVTAPEDPPDDVPPSPTPPSPVLKLNPLSPSPSETRVEKPLALIVRGFLFLPLSTSCSTVNTPSPSPAPPSIPSEGGSRRIREKLVRAPRRMTNTSTNTALGKMRVVRAYVVPNKSGPTTVAMMACRTAMAPNRRPAMRVLGRRARARDDIAGPAPPPKGVRAVAARNPIGPEEMTIPA